MSVGLDIGSKTIKIVELVQEGKNWNLRASGVVSYNGKSLYEIKDDKELIPIAETIRKLHKETKISGKDVAIALPEQYVFTRNIKFPLLTDSEIASAVKWEAEQYIPIPISEAIVQHQVIERRVNTTPQRVVVLLIAAPKNLVEKYAKLIEMAGLRLIIVETNLMAMVRALAPKDQTALIINFGAKSTDIAVSQNGVLTFSRSITTAGEAFTRAISQALRIDDAQAEEYKKTYGLQQTQLEGKVKTALNPVFALVTDEIRKTIHFYQSEEVGNSPQSVILSGGSSCMPDITSELTKALGIEVILGNPFSKVKADPEMAKTLSGYFPLYSVAVGLAMRGDE